MTTPEPSPTRIYVDADACPVKEEVYRVAARYGLPVSVVANGFIRVPQDPTDRAHRGRLGAGRGRRLDRRARRRERHRDHGRHTAGEPVREGRRPGDRSDRQAVQRGFDRHDARGAQSHARSALGRRDHGRTAAVLAARPLGVPRRARSGDPPPPARDAGLSMAAPLVQLKDIALTFGGTPLLAGVELSGLGRRARVPGRAQRLGQIDSAQDRGRADRARSRHALRAAGRDRALSAAGAGIFRRRHGARLREAGSGRATIATRRALSWMSSGSPAPRTRAVCRAARRGAPRSPRARASARHPAARRAHQPSRSAHHRVAGAHARRRARGARRDQPRPAFPGQSDARDRVARPRADPPDRARLLRPSRPGATRCWPRRRSSSTSSTARSSPRSTGCATA